MAKGERLDACFLTELAHQVLVILAVCVQEDKGGVKGEIIF